MQIFLTGATGFIGRHVLRRLLDDGHGVVASARRPEAWPALRAAGAQPHEPSLLEGPGLQRVLRGCNAVVHCAAHLRTWGSWAEFEASNVGLTRAMLQGAQAAGVGRFIHLSAASVVMQGPGPMLDVDESASTTTRPDLPYSSTKAAAEDLVLQASGAGLHTVALRPPLVWGAGDTVDGALGAHISRGRFAWFSGGRYPYATCHVDNLCEAVSLALHARLDDTGQAFFITDGEAVEFRHFLSRRIQANGWVAPRLSIPAGAAWALAGAAQGMWRRLGLRTEPPLTREAVRLLGYPFTLDIGRSRHALGYRPIVTIEQGLQQLHSRAGGSAHPRATAHRMEVN